MGESQNGCFKKTKYVKFSKKRIFLTPRYAHVTDALIVIVLMIVMKAFKICMRLILGHRNFETIIVFSTYAGFFG